MKSLTFLLEGVLVLSILLGPICTAKGVNGFLNEFGKAMDKGVDSVVKKARGATCLACCAIDAIGASESSDVIDMAIDWMFDLNSVSCPKRTKPYGKRTKIIFLVGIVASLVGFVTLICALCGCGKAYRGTTFP